MLVVVYTPFGFTVISPLFNVKLHTPLTPGTDVVLIGVHAGKVLQTVMVQLYFPTEESLDRVGNSNETVGVEDAPCVPFDTK
jgi:hypothetical protein